MELYPTLDAILDDFINAELVRMVHQAAELEDALQLHQARMKEVCHSIKSHDHWVIYGGHFPFNTYCQCCGAVISPEFDRRRHKCLSLSAHWV